MASEGQFRWLPSLRELDEDQQEVIYNSLNKGGNLIYGPAGCGKTSIILYCAKTLEDTLQNYIVFVYTKVLFNFIKSALKDLDIPSERVHRFYQWVYHTHKKYIGHPPDKDDGNKYSKWVDNLIDFFEKNPNRLPHYDYILIDEAQDFGENVSKLLHMMSKNLFVAGDPAQSIYTGIIEFDQFSTIWKPIKKNFRLLYNYRNPTSVAKLAALFLDSSSISPEEFISMVKGRDFEMRPVWYSVNSLPDQVEKIVQIINDSRGAERIGILCLNHDQANALAAQLRTKKIKVELAIGEEGYNFNDPTPKITTVHSAKGLEFDWVILPYLDAEYWDVEDSYLKIDKERLFFVAATRTKNRLYLISREGKECSLIQKIIQTDPNLIQIPRNIVKNTPSSTFDDDPF